MKDRGQTLRIILASAAGLMMTACQTTGSSKADDNYYFTPVKFEAVRATGAERARCKAAGGLVRQIENSGVDRCLSVCPGIVKTKMGVRHQAPCSTGESDLTCRELVEDGRSGLIACLDGSG